MDFLVRLRESAKAGVVTVLRTTSDYDRFEFSRRSGRIDTRRCLAWAQFQMEASMRLPLSALGDHQCLLWARGDGCAAPLCLVDHHDRADRGVDVIAHLAEDDRFLREWLAPELGSENLLGQAGWEDLQRTWRLTHAVRARRDGVWCDLRIDLDVR